MSVAERIAENAILVSEGEIESVIEWLQKVGRKVIIQSEDEISILGVNNTRIGLMRYSDPVTSVVQIMFALYGMYWTSIDECTRAMDIVNRKWKNKVKEKKNK